jgi:hypothetical protein
VQCNAAWPQDPRHVPDRLWYAIHMLEQSAGQDQVNRCVGQRQSGGDVGYARL